MRAAVIFVVMVATGRAGADSKPTEKPMKPCVVSVTNPGATIAIDGIALPDFEIATLHKVLGKPDRVEKLTSKQRYEKWNSDRTQPPTSTQVTVTNFHQVYDRYGLVFHTKHGKPFDNRETPEVLVMFFANPRVFDHTAAPAIAPKQRGCRLEINGVAIDPAVDLRPTGVTDKMDKLDLFKTKFSPTSFTTKIDSLYTAEGSRHIRIYLDAPATGRPSYAEIR